MTITERRSGFTTSSREASSRLTGSMPSFQIRVSSAPNTVSTAPPASAPSRRVRPVGLRPASWAALSRLPLRCGMRTPSLAEVGLGQLAEEDDPELDERAQVAAEGRELAGAE